MLQNYSAHPEKNGSFFQKKNFRNFILFFFSSDFHLIWVPSCPISDISQGGQGQIFSLKQKKMSYKQIREIKLNNFDPKLAKFLAKNISEFVISPLIIGLQLIKISNFLRVKIGKICKIIC